MADSTAGDKALPAGLGLGRLLTALGERSDYDAVSQCTRCGYCAQACPTYTATGRESISGRGRNQLVRGLLEKRFADPSCTADALSTCLLCGACTTACPARVPTADLVLEGRRLLRAGHTPWLAQVLTGLVFRRRGLLVFLLRWGFRLQRWGLSTLAARSRILHLLGLGGLAEASLQVDEAPERFLFEDLVLDPELKAAAESRWAYFAPCGSNFLHPRVGRATVSVLKALHGKGFFLPDSCCGLLPYNYGDLNAARDFAKANIERFEASGCPEPAVVVGDCSSCVAFMKSYPQLFLGEPEWKSRAEGYSSRVRDVLEMLPLERLPALDFPGPVTYHDSCRAKNAQGITAEPRRALRALAGDRYRELPESDCCGGAGAFAFAHPELSDRVLRKKISNIASTRSLVVAASATSCLVQLAHGLKKYYPECRVAHLCELVAEGLSSSTAAPKGPVS
ncbi:MAG: hypothetical protein A2X36_09615 [Elusimicrobia bacterium GWA2_69_24]|nr:MAG: hypothetical protein A2X36_09615 [Elusimicrobia bacterium GWA2_69_24]HBL17986.1 hypothetical protein [Elusimicrobiota bacterium]